MKTINRIKINNLCASAPKQFKQLLAIIQNCAYPPTCLLCGDDGTRQLNLCESCISSLPFYAGGCSLCAAPMPSVLDMPAICGECQLRPPDFKFTHATFSYQEPIRHLIHRLKFSAQYANARLLGTLMANQLQDLNDKPELLIPAPLHPKRYRQRGYNQTIELTRHLSKLLKIPYSVDNCKRIKDNIPQSELGAKQRRRNLHRTFSVPVKPSKQSIAIVDDVMTTGSTVRAIAKAYKKQGIQNIQIWVCARA